ncbi:hypothetical protein [Dyadobacter sp. NIV53]|uniref:hypothetical protein n=1 Tax=Dyadobacter sp. NIV53 TaxID=2861765 RepID=UPI001C88633B|nr:hypothetical protein [Dyadobacter sp. NIV53]
MKTKTIYLPFLLLIIFSGCIEDNITVADEPEVYFEVAHSNYAWNTTREGFVIDKDGNIRTYENPARWNVADSTRGMLTTSEIKENIAKTVMTDKKVDASILKNYAEKIPAISTSEYTKPASGGNDQGITSYYAYRFDRKKQVYVSILLNETGDWERQNKDQAAIEISGWLSGIKSGVK